jgi:hypothetical protein
VPSTDVANNSFRQRYINQDSAGVYFPVTWAQPGATVPPSLSMTCYKDSTGVLACSCPSNGAAALAPPAGASIAFSVSLANYPDNIVDGSKKRPGVVRLMVTGCSNFGAECYVSPNLSSADASAKVWLDVALLSGLASPPVAALSVTGNVTSTVALTVSNTEASSGITVHSGGSVGTAGGSQFFPPPGTSGDGIIHDDMALHDIAANGKLFLGVFGMPVATYGYQPAAYRLANCAAAACTPVSLANAIANNPGRIVFVDGDLMVDAIGLTLGSPTQPVLLIVNGQLNLTGAGVTINGMVYANRFNWASTATNSLITGAVIVNGDFSADANANIVYNSAMLNLINMSYGSLVRIPGSWTNWSE